MNLVLWYLLEVLWAFVLGSSDRALTRTSGVCSARACRLWSEPIDCRESKRIISDYSPERIRRIHLHNTTS